MNTTLKEIITNCGHEILSEPERLCSEMLQRGSSKTEAYQVQLVLNACPSVANQLVEGTLSKSEANTMLRAVIGETGLAESTARDILGTLMRACGIKPAWLPKSLKQQKSFNTDIFPNPKDVSSLEELEKKIAESEKQSTMFSEMDSKARSGNAKAAYALGMYFLTLDKKTKGEKGLEYFKLAADYGFGPANGGLAYYEFVKDSGSVQKAFDYFKNPTTLTGSHGWAWAYLADIFIKYRKDNILRMRMSLVMQLFMLLLSVVLFSIGGILGNFWPVIVVISLAMSVIAMLVFIMLRPCTSVRFTAYVMLLDWLLILLTLI